jgi:two-component system, NarL family, sensor kinase
MPNDSLIPFFVALTLLFALLFLFIVSYLLIQKQKQNAYQAEKDRMEFDHQNKMLTSRVEEQERTMDQISKEIHDHIGQMLSLAKMSMFVISKHASNPVQAETIENVQSLLAQLMIDVQNISHNLNGEFIRKRGLIPILEEELSYVNVPGQFKAELVLTGEPRVIVPQSELLIYRIAQEAMHNATKHAKATELKVSLDYNNDYFKMTVADNGAGFDPGNIYKLKGIGFLNMMQRAKLLNGTLDIDSKPAAGCKVILAARYEDLITEPKSVEG